MPELVSRSFQEVSDALAKALVDIKAKKEIFDKTSTAVQKASEEYQNSVNNAQYLRTELEKSLNDSMGSVQSNVRQSA
jgi:hypothetical protein